MIAGSTLLFAILAAAGAAAQPGPSSAEAVLAHVHGPEVVRQWQQEAVSRCAAASSPLECGPAYLSARYGEAAMTACREIAAAEFNGRHGGTTTSFAQHSMERTCASSIEYCRTAWRNYDRIYWSGKPSQSDPRRLEHIEAFLTETCRI